MRKNNYFQVRVIISLLILLLAPLTAGAQETLTVYEGTYESSKVPVFASNFNYYAKSQVIIPATQLEEMKGATINSLTFYTVKDDNIPYTTPCPVDVCLKEVSGLTTYSFWSLENATTVYSGTLSFVAEDTYGKVTITFTTPYVYQGGNLLIDVQNTAIGDYHPITFIGVRTSGNGAYASSEDRESFNSGDAATAWFTPKTTFDYKPSGEYLPKPGEPTATTTPGKGTEATLSWTERGTAKAWTIAYKKAKESTFTEVNVTENPYTLIDLTPDVFYSFKVCAVNGEKRSAWSATTTFETMSMIPVGTATSSNVCLPVTTNKSTGSLSQQIYWASELGGQSKSIEGIAFYQMSNSRYQRDWDIYMVHTDKASFTGATDWIPVTEDDLVFRGKFQAQAPGDAAAWCPVEFDTPFVYDGKSHIAIVVKDYSNWRAGNTHFSTYQSSEYCALYAWANVAPTNPAAIAGTQFTTSYEKNNIRLLMLDPQPCRQPGAFKVDSKGSHYANLSWKEKGKATAWKLYVESEGEQRTLSVNNTSYQLDGLTPQTTYSVKVCAVYKGECSPWTEVVEFTTDANAAPKYLDVVECGPTSAEIEWWSNDNATSWQICLNGDMDHLIAADSNPFTLTGLTAETTYTVKVRSVIEGETCPWSDGNFSFTTTESNPQPHYTEVYPGHTTAHMKWVGYSNGYNVRYRQAASRERLYFEGFEEGLDGWTVHTEGDVVQEQGWYTLSHKSQKAHGGSYVAVAMSRTEDRMEMNADNWLISPKLDLKGLLKFWVQTPPYLPDSYEVKLSTTGTDVADFTVTLKELAAVAADDDEEWTEVTIDLSAYAGQQGYIAIHHQCYGQSYLLVDDFGLYGDMLPAGDWQTVTTNEAKAAITGLTAETDYEYQVQGVEGSSQSEWTDAEPFTTLPMSVKVFIKDGNWNDASNWEPAAVPTEADDVFIMAAATIPNGVVASAREIGIEGFYRGGGEAMARAMTRKASARTRGTDNMSVPSITIKDGGQLRHSTEDNVYVTVEKTIKGYGTSATGGYRFYANPLSDNMFPSYLDGLTDSDFDLYRFDGKAADGLEWRNFKRETFWMYANNECGYLYASPVDQTLSYAGEVEETATGVERYSKVNVTGETVPFTNGWRVFANTSVSNAYVEYGDFDSETDKFEASTGCNFYKMNAAGTGYDLYKDYVVVASGEAIFVETAVKGYLRWKTEPLYDKEPSPVAGTYNMPYLPMHGKTADIDANEADKPFGDVDGNGEVDADDRILMVKFIMNEEEPDDAAWKRADLNNDGFIDAVDVVILNKMIH